MIMVEIGRETHSESEEEIVRQPRKSKRPAKVVLGNDESEIRPDSSASPARAAPRKPKQAKPKIQ